MLANTMLATFSKRWRTACGSFCFQDSSACHPKVTPKVCHHQARPPDCLWLCWVPRPPAFHPKMTPKNCQHGARHLFQKVLGHIRPPFGSKKGRCSLQADRTSMRHDGRNLFLQVVDRRWTLSSCICAFLGLQRVPKKNAQSSVRVIW